MIKLGIVGTGGMAHSHANNFTEIKGVKLVACCDIRKEASEEFAKKFKIKNYYTNLTEMLKKEELDAISNVTIDAVHYSTSMEILNYGKIHLLCEKPLALNASDANEMAELAKKTGVINMVNLSYRRSSALQRAHKLIAQGVIGDIKHIEASYLQSWLTSNAWGDWKTTPQWLWRLSSKHGSKGVLGDVGVHIVDFASFPVGNVKSVNCKLKTFHKAKNDKIGEYELDINDSAIMTVEFENGGIGTIHTTRYATGYANSLSLRIFGDKGGIKIDLDFAWNELKICKGNGIHKNKWTTIKCAETPNIYRRFIKSIKTGINDQPDFARGTHIQKVLDACFESDAKDKTILI